MNVTDEILNESKDDVLCDYDSWLLTMIYDWWLMTDNDGNTVKINIKWQH